MDRAILRFFVLCFICVGFLLAADYDIAHHEDGSLHYKIKLNREGQRHGKFKMLYPSGEKHILGSYKDGQLHGKRIIRSEAGEVIGEELYVLGELIYPATQKFQQLKFQQLKVEAAHAVEELGELQNENAPSSEVLSAVLTRVNSYRFMSGLPTDVIFRDDYIHYAQKGAELCAAIGKISHHPKNPGWPANEFQDGYKGTSKGNLSMGRTGVQAVDAFMDDSDKSNRDRVGHRRWILWKDLKEIGHGDSGKMSCLFVLGDARDDKVDVAFSTFPPQGFIPLSMFGPHYAWHCSPQKSWYSVDKNSELNIYNMHPKTFQKIGEPLPIRYRNVDTAGFGGGPAIIAQPERLALKKGASYVVEVTGVTKLKEDAPDIRYVVTFY